MEDLIDELFENVADYIADTFDAIDVDGIMDSISDSIHTLVDKFTDADGDFTEADKADLLNFITDSIGTDETAITQNLDFLANSDIPFTSDAETDFAPISLGDDSGSYSPSFTSACWEVCQASTAQDPGKRMTCGYHN